MGLWFLLGLHRKCKKIFINERIYGIIIKKHEISWPSRIGKVMTDIMKVKSENKTCYLYMRVSTAMQIEGYSLDAQRDRLLKEAKHRGYKVIGEYNDEGKSGKNIKGRPKFQEMLDDIRTAKEGERPDYVYVFKLSRFGRNAADTLSSLQFLEDFGVSLLCVEDGIDSAGAAGKLLISVYAAVAETERENIHAQTMAGRWQKAREGGWNGGFAPYGYRLEGGELKIADDEADLVREIYRMFTEENVGISTVARRLNERGIKKKIRNNANTDRIGQAFVKSVLDNPVYAGYLPYGRRKTEKIDGTRNEFHVVKQDSFEMYDGKQEAIITKEQWEKAREKRKKQGYKREKTHSLEHSHILSGILKCPKCGAPMYGNVNRKKKKDGTYYKDVWYYVCKHRRAVDGRTCDFGKYVRQDEVNEEIFGIVREIFDRDIVKEGIAGDLLSEQLDIENLKTQLKELSKKQKELRNKKDKMLSKMAEMDASDPLYDTLYDDYSNLIRGFLQQIADLESQMENLRVNIDNNGMQKESVDMLKKRVSHVLANLDNLDQAAVKEFLGTFIDRVDILETPDVLMGSNYWVKSIKFKVPFNAGKPDECDTFDVTHNYQPNENTVETVALLGKQNGKPLPDENIKELAAYLGSGNAKPDDTIEIRVDADKVYEILDREKEAKESK